MNVCMVLDSYFPPDIRVEKEARALIKAGHRVYLLSLGSISSNPIEEINGITVIRMFPTKNIFKIAWRSIQFILFFKEPYWEKFLRSIIKQYKIDVIHVHDLLLVKTAISVANKYNIPIIADLHENYPEAVRTWRKKRNSWKDKILNIILPIRRWKKLEKNILHQVDKIITVVDEAKDHYIVDCKISPEKITVVMNTEDLEEFLQITIKENIRSQYKNNFIISYIGGFGPHRGIDTIIKAMPFILEEIPDARLVLVGGKSSKKYDQELMKLIENLRIENKIEFTGWVNFDTVPSYIALSDVCLVPHHANKHTNTTIPHKLFQYMAMKKPVIVTDCKPLKRIVEDCGCGIVVPSGNSKELAKAIIQLYQDNQYAKELGENGKSAVEKKYNWNIESAKLIQLYTELKIERN